MYTLLWITVASLVAFAYAGYDRSDSSDDDDRSNESHDRSYTDWTDDSDERYNYGTTGNQITVASRSGDRPFQHLDHAAAATHFANQIPVVQQAAAKSAVAAYPGSAAKRAAYDGQLRGQAAAAARFRGYKQHDGMMVGQQKRPPPMTSPVPVYKMRPSYDSSSNEDRYNRVGGGYAAPRPVTPSRNRAADGQLRGYEAAAARLAGYNTIPAGRPTYVNMKPSQRIPTAKRYPYDGQLRGYEAAAARLSGYRDAFNNGYHPRYPIRRSQYGKGRYSNSGNRFGQRRRYASYEDNSDDSSFERHGSYKQPRRHHYHQY